MEKMPVMNAGKNKSAVQLGCLGGKARARKYTKEQLSEMGKKGGRPKKFVCVICKEPIEKNSGNLCKNKCAFNQ